MLSMNIYTYVLYICIAIFSAIKISDEVYIREKRRFAQDV